MYKGISNLEIEKTLKKLNNDDVDKDIIGVFPSDKMNKFINFHLSMKERYKISVFNFKHRQI